MDVDDPALEAADEPGAQKLHESGEHQQVDPAGVEEVGQRVVTARPVRVLRGGENGRLDPGGLGAGEPAGAARLATTQATSTPSWPCTESRIAWRFVPAPDTSTPSRKGVTPLGPAVP